MRDGFRKLRKAGLPATGIACALGGLVFLALVEPAPVLPGAAPAVTARGEAGAAKRGLRPGSESARARARLRPRRAQPALTVSTTAPLSRKAKAARSLTRQLLRAPRLVDRLALLEQRIRSFKTPGPALTILEGLLETPLRGTSYEVQALRLAALGHIGRLDLPEAEAALVARLDGEVPRPERLVAIELLRGRESGREALAQLAERDHDPRVQRRAQWALGQ